MPLNPKDEAHLAEYRQERDELVARLAQVDRIIVAIAGAAKSDGTGSHRTAPRRDRPAAGVMPSLPANTTTGAAGEFMGQTLRLAIRRLLQKSPVPLEAPEIAQALYASGYAPDAKKLKANVDTTLSRMRKDGTAERTERGYQVPEAGGGTQQHDPSQGNLIAA